MGIWDRRPPTREPILRMDEKGEVVLVAMIVCWSDELMGLVIFCNGVMKRVKNVV